MFEKRIVRSPLLLHPLQGSSCFFGRLEVGGTSIDVDYSSLLAGLPEQRLVLSFEQSEFVVGDVIFFTWVVESQVF